MPASFVTSGTAADHFTHMLRRTFDTNRDGTVTPEEFQRRLTRMVGDSAGGAPPAASGPAPRFCGFNFGRSQDITRSAKDAFAHLANAAGMMPRTKTEAEQWFNTLIKPEMERLGHHIDWVKGDKFQFTNWQGTFVVDFVAGADGADPMLAWQAS
jgi:hypothetical protein